MVHGAAGADRIRPGTTSLQAHFNGRLHVLPIEAGWQAKPEHQPFPGRPVNIPQPAEDGLLPALSGSRRQALHLSPLRHSAKAVPTGRVKRTAFEVVHNASPLRRWNILIEKVLQRPASTVLLCLRLVIIGWSRSRFAHKNQLIQPLSSDRLATADVA